MSNGSVDSRQHPRFAVELDAQILLGGENIGATTRDIGRGGICLIGPRKLPPGTQLELSLLLMLGASPFSESLNLWARVVWCTQQGELFQVGAVFTEMTAGKIGQLDMFLRFLQQEILVDGAEPAAEEEQFDTGDLDEP